MQTQLIQTSEQLHKWVQDCRKRDMDFECDIRLPSWVIWDNIESNGYLDVTYESFSKDDLQRMLTEIS